MVARSRCELDVAQLLQLAPHSRFIERHRKFLVKPSTQVYQPPTHNPMDRRDRTALDRLNKRPPLGIIKPGPGTRCLAVEQTIRASGVEPYYPVPHDLQTHATDPRRCSPAPAIVNLGQRQKPAGLVRAPRPARQSPQDRPIKIRPQHYR